MRVCFFLPSWCCLSASHIPLVLRKLLSLTTSRPQASLYRSISGARLRLLGRHHRLLQLTPMCVRASAPVWRWFDAGYFTAACTLKHVLRSFRVCQLRLRDVVTAKRSGPGILTGFFFRNMDVRSTFCAVLFCCFKTYFLCLFLFFFFLFCFLLLSITVDINAFWPFKSNWRIKLSFKWVLNGAMRNTNV